MTLKPAFIDRNLREIERETYHSVVYLHSGTEKSIYIRYVLSLDEIVDHMQIPETVSESVWQNRPKHTDAYDIETCVHRPQS